jgi:K+-sensing histidine kinase KdpD
MLSDFNQVQVMIFMLNLIIAALLLPWQLALLACLGGISLARYVYCAQGGTVILEGPVSSLQFKIFYTVLLFSGSLMAIIRNRQNFISQQKNN